MTEPDFTQIPAVHAGCADPGWKHTVHPEEGVIRFRHGMWPLWSPTHAQYRTSFLSRWRHVELVRGVVTSDTKTCQATDVVFETPIVRKVVLRTFMEDGTVGSTEWFRHLRR